MKPASALQLAKAWEDSSDVRQILQIGLTKDAARSAYHAAFHAAEALIFEKTNRIAKTHSGVRGELAHLAKNDSQITRIMTSSLGTAYKYKEVDNYDTEPNTVITIAEVEDAILLADDFVA